MKTEKFAEQLRAAITKAEHRLEAAEEKAAHWRQRQSDAEEVLKRLRASLDALEGYSYSVDLKNVPVTTAEEAAETAPIYVFRQEGGIAAILNGEPIILEPGYEIGRNSFGEECLVPLGTKAQTLPEPTKTTSVADALPSEDTGFDDPRNLI